MTDKKYIPNPDQEDELGEVLTALGVFVKSDEFKKLDDAKKAALIKQQLYLDGYYGALIELSRLS